MDVVWTLVWLAVTAIGIAMVVARRSRTWTAAGIAYLIGGIGFGTYSVVALTGAIDRPAQGSADDVAGWFVTVGFFSLLIAAMLTLIAIGRRGRRQFLVMFAAITLIVGTYQFWTTNWAARFGDTSSYCFDSDGFGPGAGIQRVPPGVRCFDGEGEVLVPADGISWFALAGWSVFYGFAASFPIMGLAWAARQRSVIALPQPPGTTR